MPVVHRIMRGSPYQLSYLFAPCLCQLSGSLAPSPCQLSCYLHPEALRAATTSLNPRRLEQRESKESTCASAHVEYQLEDLTSHDCLANVQAACDVLSQDCLEGWAVVRPLVMAMDWARSLQSRGHVINLPLQDVAVSQSPRCFFCRCCCCCCC